MSEKEPEKEAEVHWAKYRAYVCNPCNLLFGYLDPEVHHQGRDLKLCPQCQSNKGVVGTFSPEDVKDTRRANRRELSFEAHLYASASKSPFADGEI